MSEYDPEAIYEYRLRSLQRKEELEAAYIGQKKQESRLNRSIIPAILVPSIGAVALLKYGHIEGDLEVAGAVYLSSIASILGFTYGAASSEDYRSRANSSAREASEICQELEIGPDRWITDELS